MENNEKMQGKQFFKISLTEVGCLGNGDSYVRGVSQEYSQLVKLNYLKETPPWSD